MTYLRHISAYLRACVNYERARINAINTSTRCNKAATSLSICRTRVIEADIAWRKFELGVHIDVLGDRAPGELRHYRSSVIPTNLPTDFNGDVSAAQTALHVAEGALETARRVEVDASTTRTDALTALVIGRGHPC